MKYIKKFYWLLFSFFIFLVYLFTIAPSVVEIDSGELAAVQATLGIAHPTGYPLFTIIGFLFSSIPLGFTKIYQLNLLAAIWCSLGAGIFVYTVKMILDNLALFGKTKSATKSKNAKDKKSRNLKTQKQELLPEASKYLIAVLSGFILSFSRTYWMQSTSVEVYSLHIFLMSLIILLLLKAYLFESTETNKIFKKRWMIFAVMLALGFTNHMTTILILPGAAYLYFEKNKFRKSSFKTILMMFLFFIPVVILFYSYLPLRASQNPATNWGNPINLENLFRHISGKQYQVWLFSSAEAAKKQLVYFFSAVPKEFNISLFISLLGLFLSFFSAKKLFIFLLITFITAVIYSINYNIVDIDSYFLLAYITLSFFAVFGLANILSFLKHRKHRYAIPLVLISLFIAAEGYFNFIETDQSDMVTFKDYTLNLLNSTKKNSVIFSYQWDYFVSESYYFRFVENYRKDVAVIDKELMRRSWYYNQLKNNYPSVLKGVENYVNVFISSVKPFERDEPYNPDVIEMNYRNLMTAITLENVNRRNFYVAPEIFENEMQRGEYSLPKGYVLVPDLFLFKVVKQNGYIPAADPDFKIRFPKVENKYTEFIKNNVATMLARRAFYELQNDKIDRARIYIKKIRSDFPDYLLPAGLSQIRTN